MKEAVAGILIFNNKLLIGKKIVKEGHFLSGGWHIPGGHVNKGESQEEAVIREYKEETDLDISVVNKLCEHYVKQTDTKVIWFICFSNTDKFKPMDDLTEIKFISPKDVLVECDLRATSLWPKEVFNYLSSL